ncbi:MAG: 23S rRNA (pseudouridine(1915)-N(3))-methyltransferase RlmH [Defluviitaleaceae bacterium]|nr:23S rRNA (pseudouridine(1915)-N(3))-methyltransferase RlmH [Defluviitaleaceae bacterium]
MYNFTKIDIICVGNLKEPYLRDAEAEFLKRLKPYGKLNITELKSNDKILKIFSPHSFKIALDVQGEKVSSESLADKLKNLAVQGHSHIEFVIGDAHGLEDHILQACHGRISLSPLTFTHQMARIILLEQIYRCCRILNNEPYHK